jgi:hypothetical protein
MGELLPAHWTPAYRRPEDEQKLEKFHHDQRSARKDNSETVALSVLDANLECEDGFQREGYERGPSDRDEVEREIIPAM